MKVLAIALTLCALTASADGITVSLPMDSRTLPFVGDGIEEVVVYGDGIVEAENCIVMKVNTWSNLVQRIRRLESVANRVWAAQNATESGRKAMHGNIVKTGIDTNDMVKCILYSDGYTHYEKMQEKKVPTNTRQPREESPKFGSRGSYRPDIPARLREIREKRQNQTPVIVTETVRANAPVMPVEGGNK